MSLFGGEPFTARAVQSEVTVEVAEGQSLLQALLDAGISVNYSCEGGVCGSCVVPLLSGEVIHEDEYLTQDEHDSKICTCVSRGVGHIELDV